MSKEGVNADFTQRIVLATEEIPLYRVPDGESVALERLDPGEVQAEIDCPAGEEIFILSGDLRHPPRRHLDQESPRVPACSVVVKRSDLLDEARASHPMTGNR
jgi:hypothetical protein